jgi:hypothetical protein
MKAVEESMVRAARSRINWKVGMVFPGAIEMTLAGWGTPTTRGRLNALIAGLAGAENFTKFYQKGGKQFFGNREIRVDELVRVVRS